MNKYDTTHITLTANRKDEADNDEQIAVELRIKAEAMYKRIEDWKVRKVLPKEESVASPTISASTDDEFDNLPF